MKNGIYMYTCGFYKLTLSLFQIVNFASCERVFIGLIDQHTVSRLACLVPGPVDTGYGVEKNLKKCNWRRTARKRERTTPQTLRKHVNDK